MSIYIPWTRQERRRWWALVCTSKLKVDKVRVLLAAWNEGRHLFNLFSVRQLWHLQNDHDIKNISLHLNREHCHQPTVTREMVFYLCKKKAGWTLQGKMWLEPRTPVCSKSPTKSARRLASRAPRCTCSSSCLYPTPGAWATSNKG